MITPEYNGIIEDPRTDEQKALDYKYEDLTLAGITPPNWVDINSKHLKTFEIQNQDGSSSCVAQATAKILAMHEVIEGRNYTRLCPKFIYTRRFNYPDGGMNLPNALDIACKYGSCQETIMPCDDKGESFMNDKTELPVAELNAKNYRGKLYFSIKVDIDKIAEVLEQGYGVLLGFRFDYDEWTDVPFVNPNSQKKCGHGVAAVDYVLYEGKKALVIEDSWGPHYGKGGRRIITEEFLMARCFYAGYVTSLPNYIFTKTLRKGDKGLEVKMLQQKLNCPVDGIFGPITLQAVKKFQEAHLLVPDGIVGPLTNKELNK